MALRTKDLKLKVVRDFLYDVRLKWYDIGIELDVEVVDLDEIKGRELNDGDCLREMLIKRLKFVENRLTWKKLADALVAKAVNELELAEKCMTIESHFLLSIPMVS